MPRATACLAAVEIATLTWVDWFSNRGCWNPSATSRRQKPRNAYYAMLDEQNLAA